MQLDQRVSFDQFGKIGQSLSQILRESLTGGAFDTACSPSQRGAVSLEVKSARIGSLDVGAVMTVAASFWDSWGEPISKKVIVDTVSEGIKKYLRRLLGQGDADVSEKIVEQGKVLDQILISLQTLTRTLADVDARAISVKVGGKVAFDLDRADIDAFTVEPVAGQDVIVQAYPLSLHLETGKGWLRIARVPADGVLKPTTSRSEVLADDGRATSAVMDQLGAIWRHNQQHPRDKRIPSLVVRPFVSNNGLVRNVQIAGFAQDRLE